MKKDIKEYSIDSLKTIQISDLLTEEQWEDVQSLESEVQESFQKAQMFRTETEMRVSVLNDIKHPTNASKYWQAVREQNVMFQNLATLSFDYRRNEVAIRRLEDEIKEAKGYDLEEKLIDLDEKKFAKKQLQLQAQHRVRELKEWSKIKEELDDGSFDTKDVNTHQLESYAKRYLRETKTAIETKSSMSPSEARNLIGQTQSMLKECEKKGILNKVINESIGEEAGNIMPKLGYNLTK